jgi:hypothetical protein
MADTSYIKRVVEPFLRKQLELVYGVPFRSRRVQLTPGGTHAFDAVSEDGMIVAAMKCSSGLTSGGKNPAGKVKGCVADLYYLSLASAATRLIVLTNAEFYGIFMKDMKGRIPPNIEVKLLHLPPEMESKVCEIQQLASKEVSARPLAE